MRISDWSSYVCSSDLGKLSLAPRIVIARISRGSVRGLAAPPDIGGHLRAAAPCDRDRRQANCLDSHRTSLPLYLAAHCWKHPADPAHEGRKHQNTDLEKRKSAVQGKSVSVRVDLGGRLLIQKKNKKNSN